MDCSLPGFSIHGILQARILEWVTISFPGDLPDPGIEPRSPALEADALTSEPPGKAPGPITSWQIEGEKVEAMTGFIFLDSKITMDNDCCHEIKRCLLLARKDLTNLDSILGLPWWLRG